MSHPHGISLSSGLLLSTRNRKGSQLSKIAHCWLLPALQVSTQRPCPPRNLQKHPPPLQNLATQSHCLVPDFIALTRIWNYYVQLSPYWVMAAAPSWNRCSVRPGTSSAFFMAVFPAQDPMPATAKCWVHERGRASGEENRSPRKDLTVCVC